MCGNGSGDVAAEKFKELNENKSRLWKLELTSRVLALRIGSLKALTLLSVLLGNCSSCRTMLLAIVEHRRRRDRVLEKGRCCYKMANAKAFFVAQTPRRRFACHKQALSGNHQTEAGADQQKIIQKFFEGASYTLQLYACGIHSPTHALNHSSSPPTTGHHLLWTKHST